MKNLKKTTLILILLNFGIVTGCGRSASFQKEQAYYRQDSHYGNKKNSTTRRLEKYGQPRKRIFILPFMNETPVGGEGLGKFAAEELMRQLRGSHKAIAPEDLKTAVSSKDFYSGEKIRLSLLVREGKRLGVALIAVGKIKRVLYRQQGDDVGLFRGKKSVAAVDLEMRLFDCSEGKEVLFDEKNADSSMSQINLFKNGEDSDSLVQRKELIQQAIRNAIYALGSDILRAIDKINWEGRIAKISGGRIFVNAGRATGLNIGDILKVMTQGEDIYDPETAAYLGRSQGQPKGTLEIIDFLGPDGSIAVTHSGGGFFENDVVQLY